MAGVRLLAGALTTLALLGGCTAARPPGVDGALLDDWPALPAPTALTPAAGSCHLDFAEAGPRGGYAPVPCERPHKSETVHVGTFTGAAAAAAAPPARTSPARHAAYAACDAQATRFLGRNFRYGRLWLGVTVPSGPGWTGGARWYRCELGEVADVENFGPLVSRTGSLRQVLTRPTKLDLTCYQVSASAAGAITAMAPVGCRNVHNSEFVGYFLAPAGTAYPASGADWERLHTGCRPVVAGYVKVPNNADLRYRTGTVAVPHTEEDWAGGNRGVRCYLYVNDGRFTSSLRNAGVRGLPER
ncbi:MAG TPA: septum formation family protein [Pilimelia sp.]|nr:septum formation family protein [Pilimelia sp.]